MWGTGLRLRFFLLSLFALLLVSVGITSLLAYFYQAERIAFIDDQIRETATAIVDSELSDLKTYDYQLANKLISEELGPDRVGKFFVVRNSQEQILFQTDNMTLLELSIPRTPKWVTLHDEGRLIRALNLSLPNFPNRTLQVGVITDSNFIYWSTFTQRTMVLIASVVGLVLLVTWFLSAQLFAPFRELEFFLHKASQHLAEKKDIPDLPEAALGSGGRSRDEFQRLVDGLSQLVARVNQNNKMTKSWTYQMAHEIKTPLTLLNREMERLQETYGWGEEENQELQRQLGRVSRTVTDFLNWAELVGMDRPDNLHVMKLNQVVQDLCMPLQRVYDHRLNWSVDRETEVLCNPLHLEQVIENLVVNALRYSTGEVLVTLQTRRLRVEDQGTGLPASVLERLGSPFNKGPQRAGREKGTGLGIAWVQSVCSLYGWHIDWDSNDSGLVVTVRFPELS